MRLLRMLRQTVGRRAYCVADNAEVKYEDLIILWKSGAYWIRLNPLMDWEYFVGTLAEAKQYADDNICYNQYDAVIYDADGEEVARRSWWGVEADEDEDGDIIRFGKFGYYGEWEEN